MNIQISNVAIRQNANGLFSLNDLHKAAGGAEKYKPALFLRLQQTQNLVNEINQSTDMYFAIETSRGGNNAGTYVCRELVIAYGMWINASFALKVIQCFLETQQTEKLTPAQKQQIQEAVRARHHSTGEHWQEIYRKLHSYLKVNSYHEITQKQFQVALNFLASIENAPTLFTQTSPMLSDHEISRFAVITYYLDIATKQLKGLSEPLKELGANKEGVAAWTLWSESQSWIRHCQETLSRLQPSMTEQRFKEQVQNCLQHI